MKKMRARATNGSQNELGVRSWAPERNYLERQNEESGGQDERRLRQNDANGRQYEGPGGECGQNGGMDAATTRTTRKRQPEGNGRQDETRGRQNHINVRPCIC